MNRWMFTRVGSLLMAAMLVLTGDRGGSSLPVIAAEAPTAAAAAEGPPSDPLSPPREPAAVDREEIRKQQQVLAAVLALAGITVCGVLLIGITLIAGRMVRRRLQTEVPPAGPLPADWFLKRPGTHRPDPGPPPASTVETNVENMD